MPRRVLPSCVAEPLVVSQVRREKQSLQSRDARHRSWVACFPACPGLRDPIGSTFSAGRRGSRHIHFRTRKIRAIGVLGLAFEALNGRRKTNLDWQRWKQAITCRGENEGIPIPRRKLVLMQWPSAKEDGPSPGEFSVREGRNSLFEAF